MYNNTVDILNGTTNESQQHHENIKVTVRIRPLLEKEKQYGEETLSVLGVSLLFFFF